MLQRGARIALVAPSGPLRSQDDLQLAVQNVESMGWRPCPAPSALARSGYFAGTDAERSADLVAAVTDNTIDGIWCLRGGYGAARLLPTMPIDLIRCHPKALIGYSDITALHAAWQCAGLISYHASTARAVLTPFTRDSFVRTVCERVDGAGTMPAAQTLREGQVTGRLAGGNLALVASLCGTPWALDFRSAIVVLEDINEASYRIDRMLTQLRLAGAFDGCAGFLFGQFTDCSADSDDGARAVESVAQECADLCNVPAIFGAPVGHVPDQWALPLGALATMDATHRTLRVHHYDSH